MQMLLDYHVTLFLVDEENYASSRTKPFLPISRNTMIKLKDICSF